MKPEFECAAAASFLDSGRLLSNVSNCAAVIAALGALLARRNVERLVFAGSMLFWPVVCYFALRVAIDASLFRAMGPAPADSGRALDELLHAWGLGNKKPARSIAERSHGALGLWKRTIVTAALQLVALAAALVMHVWVR
jgi:hypothetical protein